MEQDKKDSEAVLGSFTSAMGLALGDLLLLTGRTDRLGECLAAIETATLGTLLASDFQHDGASPPRARSLTRAALGVVVAWHEQLSDLSGVAEAVSLLQDALEAMGVLHTYSPPTERDVD
jgi:hypothetical protein